MSGSSTSRSASPAPRRRRRCSRPRGGRSPATASAIPTPRASRRCARRSPPHYRERYGVAVDPAEIAVTTGSSAAFQLAFLAAFEPGDRVALAAPGYPAYRNILSALGLETVLIEVGENAHYQPNPELLADALRPHRG